MVAERAPNAIACLDTFHLVAWATKALDERRRNEWQGLRNCGHAGATKAIKLWL